MGAAGVAPAGVSVGAIMVGVGGNSVGGVLLVGLGVESAPQATATMVRNKQIQNLKERIKTLKSPVFNILGVPICYIILAAKMNGFFTIIKNIAMPILRNLHTAKGHKLRFLSVQKAQFLAGLNVSPITFKIGLFCLKKDLTTSTESAIIYPDFPTQRLDGNARCSANLIFFIYSPIPLFKSNDLPVWAINKPQPQFFKK